MNFSQSTRTVPIPAPACHDAVKANTVAGLQGLTSVYTESIIWSDPNSLTAMTQPSLRSGGEQITITFLPSHIEIHVESPEQFVDWLKSRKTATTIERTLQECLNTHSTTSTPVRQSD